MLTEIQYRTFDELYDSASSDLKMFDLENMINRFDLIKVAQRVNSDLGIRISMSKHKVLEVSKRVARLPSDMHVMNFAVIMEGRNVTKPTEHLKTYTDGLLDGLLQTKMFQLNQFSDIYDIVQGANQITHDLDTENLLVQAFGSDGSLLQFEVEITDPNSLNIISASPTTIRAVKVVVIGAKANTTESMQTVTDIVEIADSPSNPYVIRWTDRKFTKYNKFVRMSLEKSKSVSPDSENLQGRCFHQGYIKNGFLHTNFEEGEVLINYQSLMEDDHGNLLVMDHPEINEYYEYAVKERILENLYLAGEEVANKLQLIQGKLRISRNIAKGYVNMPDFAEFKKVVEMNRKAMYHKYYRMFQS